MGLYQKLANVMANISGVEKKGKNTFFNYKFTTADDAYGAVRTALAEEGLAFIASMVDVQQHDTGQTDKSGNPVVRTVAKFEYRFVDPETGEIQTCLWHGEATDSQDKGVSKASTSALKYFLLKTFIISTEADDPDKSDGYEPKRKPAPSPAAIRDAGNKLDEQPERPAKPANVVPMLQPGEPEATTTRAALSPDKLVTMLKTKATTVKADVTRDAHGIIEPMPEDDAQKLAIEIQTIMDKPTRIWILNQAFGVGSCKDLNPREAAAIRAWLNADKPAARSDAEGVKALVAILAAQAEAPAQEAK